MCHFLKSMRVWFESNTTKHTAITGWIKQFEFEFLSAKKKEKHHPNNYIVRIFEHKKQHQKQGVGMFTPFKNSWFKLVLGKMSSVEIFSYQNWIKETHNLFTSQHTKSTLGPITNYASTPIPFSITGAYWWYIYCKTVVAHLKWPNNPVPVITTNIPVFFIMIITSVIMLTLTTKTCF